MNPEESKPQFIPMPSAQLTISAEADKLFPVRHNEWQRLCRRVAQSANHAPYFASLGWACVGISASSILAYFPWVAAASQLPESARSQYAYISPLLIVAAIASFVVALVCWLANHNAKQMRQVSVKEILEEMEAIYEPYKPVGAGDIGSAAAAARGLLSRFRRK